MNILKFGAALWLVVLLGLVQASAASAGNGNGKGNGNDKGQGPKKDSVQSVLASVPLPELPAKAAGLVLDAKPKDREGVALEVVRYVADARAASIAPVVGSVARALQGSAAAIAATATQLVPAEAAGIAQAAVQAAPAYAAQIKRALGTAQDTGEPVVVTNPGKRPTVPPGWAHSSKNGSIRGNRPAIPPGLVRDPKPGRDPQGRRRYGSP